MPIAIIFVSSKSNAAQGLTSVIRWKTFSLRFLLLLVALSFGAMYWSLRVRQEPVPWPARVGLCSLGEVKRYEHGELASYVTAAGAPAFKALIIVGPKSRRHSPASVVVDYYELSNPKMVAVRGGHISRGDFGVIGDSPRPRQSTTWWGWRSHDGWTTAFQTTGLTAETSLKLYVDYALTFDFTKEAAALFEEMRVRLPR